MGEVIRLADLSRLATASSLKQDQRRVSHATVHLEPDLEKLLTFRLLRQIAFNLGIDTSQAPFGPEVLEQSERR